MKDIKVQVQGRFTRPPKIEGYKPYFVVVVGERVTFLYRPVK